MLTALSNYHLRGLCQMTLEWLSSPTEGIHQPWITSVVFVRITGGPCRSTVQDSDSALSFTVLDANIGQDLPGPRLTCSGAVERPQGKTLNDIN